MGGPPSTAFTPNQTTCTNRANPPEFILIKPSRLGFERAPRFHVIKTKKKRLNFFLAIFVFYLHFICVFWALHVCAEAKCVYRYSYGLWPRHSSCSCVVYPLPLFAACPCFGSCWLLPSWWKLPYAVSNAIVEVVNIFPYWT